MIRPPLLKPGNTVGIVAPARMILPSQIARGIATLESWGLEVVQGESLFCKEGYFAGTDRQRLEDFQQMIDLSSVNCIFCARGGYGMTRILDDLDLSPLQKSPKWIIGFSDITALHLALNKAGIESIHGLMPVQFDYVDSESSADQLRRLLFRGDGSISAQRNEYNRNGTVSAPIVGGNLSLICDSLGTSSEVQTHDRILFLEEIDEYLYKIDRMLVQLKRAGKLDQLKGLVIGDFSNTKDTQIPFGKLLETVILEHVSNYDYPVAFNLPAGHEIPNFSIPLMREVKLHVTNSETVLSF
ncbi:LD-carboxypeptidase [Fulvivirga sp. M361]|uniref:S66 peptidase family protein n=1 Tax=Fulvivirga sp. M361 TaxID=2594266 RepID=UPI002102FE8F|nr:LD-carboxypeptidase [Fulvivirga sp. M361]